MIFFPHKFSQIFPALRLFFFPNFPGPTFIQGPTFILFAKFSRPYVYSLPYVYSRLQSIKFALLRLQWERLGFSVVQVTPPKFQTIQDMKQVFVFSTVVSKENFQFSITANGEGRSARHATLVLLLVRAAQPLVRPMIVCLCICIKVFAQDPIQYTILGTLLLYNIKRVVGYQYKETKEIRPVSLYLSVYVFLFLYLE